MSAFPDTALAVVFIVVIGGALLWLLFLGVRWLAVWIGQTIARIIGGDVPGGRR